MRIVISYFLFLWSVLGAPACQPPKYRIGLTHVDDSDMVVKNISISLRDVSPRKLVCLAQTLRELCRDRNHILVYIFSSHGASFTWMSYQEINEELGKALAQLHALYSFDGDKHEEYLRIMPVGPHSRPVPKDGPDSTRIDLPVSDTPRCRLELNSRCLNAFEDIYYPEEAVALKASGKVNLTATITPAGKVKQVRVVRSESTPKGFESILGKAAAQNLSHWRLEAAAKSDPIQITYSYDIDASLRLEDGTRVRWNLPKEVGISHRPTP